jgi:serine/threonine-protein kinase HipA
LREQQRMPLGNQPKTGKSSLPGIQDKIVLAAIDGAWHQVHDGFPSTHILKPAPRDGSTTIFDEEYGNRLARRLGLATFDTSLEEFGEISALVIERYDRSPSAPEGRLHQEDMSQALGAGGREKYQRYSRGKVTLQKVAGLLASADIANLKTLLALNTMSVAVGNLDLHAKNISLLHLPDETTQLAPAYDVVPLAHRGLDGEMSFSVNMVYEHDRITIVDLEYEARMWGLKDPAPLIRETLEQIEAFTRAESPDARAYEGLAADIQRFTANLLRGLPAGHP